MSREEFYRQVETLLQKGYPSAAGIESVEFAKHLEPLEERVEELDALTKEPEEGHIPFVIVIKSELVAAEKAMQLVERNEQNGFTVIDADDLEGFEPIEGIELPGGMAYLLVDIDPGKRTLNVTPDEAMEKIKGGDRSPLTIDEGVALITHHPEVVMKNNGFSLLGSRCGDRRVTALWISKGKPKLGWCWAGNPHTWLGSASCGSRVGA